MSRQTVMVLGAGGFIGRHLAERLAAQGHEVVAATRTVAKFSHPGIHNIVADYDDASHFSSLVPRCGLVIHAASNSTPGSSAAQPQLDGNLRTTLALVESLQPAPGCRLLYLSSGGTLYGDRESPASEGDLLRPRSYHGAGKAAAEHFINAWSEQYGGTAVILRPSNIYGPGQAARSGFAIIPTALDCATRNMPLTLWGDGQSVRDYLYIDDFVALCDAALEAPLAPGSHVFNATSNNDIALDALIDRIDHVTGRPLQRIYRPARPADIHRSMADSAAARHAFGWRPVVSIDDGLHRTWQWLRTQA